MTGTPRPGAILAVAAGAHALCHGSKVTLQVVTLTVAAREFDVGPEEMGLAITVFLLAMGFTSVPAGLASDRFGTARVLTAFFGTLGLAGLACALASSYSGFVLAHGLLGVAAGMMHPSALGLLSLSIPPERLGRVMGTFGVFGSVGTAAMPLLVGTALGWRFGFLVLAGLGFTGAIVTGLLRRSGAVPDSVPSGAALEVPGGSFRMGMVLLLAAMSVNGFLLDGFSTLFPVTLAAASDALQSTTALTFLVLAIGGVGQWVGGILARDHFASSRFAIILVLQPLVLLSIGTSLAEPAWPLMLMGSFAFLNFMTQPIENKLLAVYTTAQRRSTAYALKFLVALMVSAPAPWLVGRFLEQGVDQAHIYRLLALSGVVGVVAGYLFLRRARRLRTRHARQPAADGRR